MVKGYVRYRGNDKWQLEVDFGSYVDLKTDEQKRHKKYKLIQAKGIREAEKALSKFVAEVTDNGESTAVQ
ncbi:hypothetical protein F9U64_01380 [Gracilibacillus oryzae]|uniref:AP2-like integrase N-terminal domain-containing protein n=1 Tax=Gracilibacillus oryzae TaxID=1672701 RepID=A0A7C8L9K1_9BACI|nr:hypothetical protein [Gracilibacillus oryzae]KAB8139077.1 hypothetical protein F9U64_01380 [Gracilibacillus oryzae]